MESKDVMTGLCDFLSGKRNNSATTDNKHNVKADRYQVVGGGDRRVATIGNSFLDADIIRQAGVSPELYRPKDYASDKKVEDLLAYPSLEKIYDILEEGSAEGSIRDVAGLMGTLFFLRLHLHAVNGLNVPANHRSLYLWLSLEWFNSIAGISITPKRHFASESINNTYQALRKDITKLWLSTSEAAEHGFGDARKIQREFSCTDFASHTEKQNRRMA